MKKVHAKRNECVFFTTLTILLKLIGAWFNCELAISLWVQKWLLNLQSIFASGALGGQSAERTAHGGGGCTCVLCKQLCLRVSLFALAAG